MCRSRCRISRWLSAWEHRSANLKAMGLGPICGQLDFFLKFHFHCHSGCSVIFSYVRVDHQHRQYSFILFWFCCQVTHLFVDVPRHATLEAVITIRPSTNTFVCVRPDSLETDVKQVITSPDKNVIPCSIDHFLFSDTFSSQISTSVPLDNITVTFRRERYVTTHMDRFCVTVAMVTVEKMANTAKVMEDEEIIFWLTIPMTCKFNIHDGQTSVASTFWQLQWHEIFILFKLVLRVHGWTRWLLIPKTIKKRKKRLCVRLRLGDKHNLRKSSDRKAQISPVSGTNAFLICAFRSEDFLRWCLSPERNLTHNLLFLFPIVFGINLIHFFKENNFSATMVTI